MTSLRETLNDLHTKCGLDLTKTTTAILQDQPLNQQIIEWALNKLLTPRARTKTGPRSRPSQGRQTAKPKLPSESQKAANRKATQRFVAQSIFDHQLRGGHRVGNLHVYELRAY